LESKEKINDFEKNQLELINGLIKESKQKEEYYMQ
jgi:hypothetical protein